MSRTLERAREIFDAADPFAGHELAGLWCARMGLTPPEPGDGAFEDVRIATGGEAPGLLGVLTGHDEDFLGVGVWPLGTLIEGVNPTPIHDPPCTHPSAWDAADDRPGWAARAAFARLRDDLTEGERVGEAVERARLERPDAWEAADDERYRARAGRFRVAHVAVGGDFQRGTLVVTPDLPSAIAARLVMGATAWACLHDEAMGFFEPPPDALVSEGGPVRTVVMLAQAVPGDDPGDGARAAAWIAQRGGDQVASLHAPIGALEGVGELVERAGRPVSPWELAWARSDARVIRQAVDLAVRDEGHKRRTPGAALHELPADDAPPGRVLPPSTLEAARAYLLDEWAPQREDGHAPGETLRLLNVDDELFRFVGTRYAPLRPSALRQGVRRWASSCVIKKLKKVKDRITGEDRWAVAWPPANPSDRQVSGIVTAAADEALVARGDTDASSRFFVRPMFDEHAEPDWSLPAHERVVPDDELGGLPAPESVIAVRNGLLDLEAWAGGELRLLPHTPRFFNRTVLGFDLPAGEIRDALAAGAMHELVASLCPEWLAFLQESFALDDDEGEDNIRQLQKWFGYVLTSDTSRHFGNLCFWHGPPGTGKGTARDVLGALLGQANWISSRFDKLGDGPHMASWRDKLLAVFPDADVPMRADAKLAVEVIAMITGGDPISMRQLYREEQPNVRLPTRILVLCNVMPTLDDQAGKLKRRMIVFDWRRVVRNPDRGLSERLTRPRSMLGVFLWALMGKAMLEEDGEHGQAEASRGPLQDFGEAAAHIPPDFVDDMLLVYTEDGGEDQGVGPDDWVSTDRLYSLWVKYWRDVLRRESQTMPLNRFFMTLRPLLQGRGWPSSTAVKRKDGDHRRNGYVGLKISAAGLALLSGGSFAGDDDDLPIGA